MLLMKFLRKGRNNMKKIIKPATKEIVDFHCDFTGTKLEYSACDVRIFFGYGSKHDGCSITLDLSDDAAEDLLEFIKSKLSKEAKLHLKEKIIQLNDRYSESMDTRAWSECELIGNNKHIFEYLSE